MKQKIRTIPDLSSNLPAWQEPDEERLWKWSRNVIDEFKDLSNENIKIKLQETAFPFAICCENWTHDFNISSCIRNANAFNARCVYVIGNKRFDKRGAAGVFNYTEVKFLPTVDDFIELKKQYHVVGMDNIPGAKSINDVTWKANTLFVFGSEGTGLTPGMQGMCDELVYIKQFGSVRSLNAATASGIVMFDFTSRYQES